jgi:hypothetical protein
MIINKCMMEDADPLHEILRSHGEHHIDQAFSLISNKLVVEDVLFVREILHQLVEVASLKQHQFF